MGAAVPVPVRDSVVVVGCALLANVSVAEAAPAACGLKVTLNDVLCPACKVNGKENPLTLNVELLLLTDVTVTLALLAVNLPDAVPLVPTIVSPMARVLGETASWPAEPEDPDEFDDVELLLTPWQALINMKRLSRITAPKKSCSFFHNIPLFVVSSMRVQSNLLRALIPEGGICDSVGRTGR